MKVAGEWQWFIRVQEKNTLNASACICIFCWTRLLKLVDLEAKLFFVFSSAPDYHSAPERLIFDISTNTLQSIVPQSQESSENPAQAGESQNPIECSYCPRTFRSHDTAKRHERIHTGERPYVCQVCSKSFADRSSLWQHSRLHNGKRPFQCNHCSRSFRWRKSLVSHNCLESRGIGEVAKSTGLCNYFITLSYCYSWFDRYMHSVFERLWPALLCLVSIF